MRAVAADRFGGPDVLRLHILRVPEIDASEVLIATHTAGVGRWDADMREGWWPDGRPPLPLDVVRGVLEGFQPLVFLAAAQPLQRLQAAAVRVEARGDLLQSPVPALAHQRENPGDGDSRALLRLLRRALERGGASGGGEGFPEEGFHFGHVILSGAKDPSRLSGEVTLRGSSLRSE